MVQGRFEALRKLIACTPTTFSKSPTLLLTYILLISQKLYPENECLVPYLSGPGVAKMSKWSGSAEAVFPTVSQPDAQERDIWGRPI